MQGSARSSFPFEIDLGVHFISGLQWASRLWKWVNLQIHLMKEINWVFKMEERGKVECSIHPTISQRSRRSRHHSARSMNEFWGEIKQKQKHCLLCIAVQRCYRKQWQLGCWRGVCIVYNIKMGAIPSLVSHNTAHGVGWGGGGVSRKKQLQ